MNMFDLLGTSLLDLLYELEDTGTVPMVGGGYGIFLKREHTLRAQIPTLLERLPDARSTNDIDLFLQTELLTSPERAERIATGLGRLDYRVIDRHRYWQFVKRYSDDEAYREVKIDLLTRTPPNAQLELVRVDKRRVKPRSSVGLHGRHTPEAFAVEEHPIRVTAEGTRSDGKVYRGDVLVPNAWPWLMMKLFAYRDHQEERRGAIRGFGSHHALDLFSIVAMLTEGEYQQATGLGREYRSHPQSREAAQIVFEHFSTVESLGALRVREQVYRLDSKDLEEFLSVLREFFSRE